MPTAMNVYKRRACNVQIVNCRALNGPDLSLGLLKPVSEAVGLSATFSAASATTTVTSATTTVTAAASPVTAAAVAAASTATATATATTGSAFLSLTDTEGAPIHVIAVEAADRGFAVFAAAQCYKGKPTRAPGFTVKGDMEIHGPAEVFEEGTDLVFGCREGQIAHVEFHLCLGMLQPVQRDSCRVLVRRAEAIR